MIFLRGALQFLASYKDPTSAKQMYFDFVKISHWLLSTYLDYAMLPTFDQQGAWNKSNGKITYEKVKYLCWESKEFCWESKGSLLNAFKLVESIWLYLSLFYSYNLLMSTNWLTIGYIWCSSNVLVNTSSHCHHHHHNHYHLVFPFRPKRGLGLTPAVSLRLSVV